MAREERLMASVASNRLSSLCLAICVSSPAVFPDASSKHRFWRNPSPWPRTTRRPRKRDIIPSGILLLLFISFRLEEKLRQASTTSGGEGEMRASEGCFARLFRSACPFELAMRDERCLRLLERKGPRLPASSTASCFSLSPVLQSSPSKVLT